MALYLTIDQGNTAAKLALWRNDALLDLLIEPSLSVDKIECFMAKHGVADAAIYCSVATPGDEIVNGITHLAHRVSRLTNATPLPIAIDYRTPCTLGTDRIAAAVGAWANHPGKNMLVVDAGTAVTYDVVSADGHFRGGNIAPGMRMRLDALHRFTKRLPQVEVPQIRHLHGLRHYFGNDSRSHLRHSGSHILLPRKAGQRHPRGHDRRLGKPAQRTLRFRDCRGTRPRKQRIKQNIIIQ